MFLSNLRAMWLLCALHSKRRPCAVLEIWLQGCCDVIFLATGSGANPSPKACVVLEDRQDVQQELDVMEMCFL